MRRVVRIARDRIPAPALLAAARIDTAHDAELGLHRAVVADGRTDDEYVADDHRRRGDRVIHPGVAEFRPHVPVEPDLSVVPEILAGRAGCAVERDHPRIQRADEDAMPARRARFGIRVHPRAHAPIGDLGIVLVAVEVRIVAPDLRTRRRIERNDDGAAGRQVQPAFCEYRVRLESEGFLCSLAEFPGLVAPGFFEFADVVARDLIEARVLHAVLAAAVVVPGAIVLGMRQGACRQRRDGQGDKLAARAFLDRLRHAQFTSTPRAARTSFERGSSSVPDDG